MTTTNKVSKTQGTLIAADKPKTVRINFDIDGSVHDELVLNCELENRTIAGKTRELIGLWLRTQRGADVLHVDGSRCPYDFAKLAAKR